MERKELAKALAAELGLEAVYAGVPSCAYKVGDYTFNRDGSISGDLEAIRDFLIRHDYIQRASPTVDDEQAENTVHTDDNDEDVTDDDPEAAGNIDGIELSMPLEGLTPQQLMNLIRILYSRQKLLAAMLRNDSIHIDEELIGLLNDEKSGTTERILELLQTERQVGMASGFDITANTFALMLAEGDQSEALRLLCALIKRARLAGFVSARLIDPAEGETKYYVNSFLNQLGFGGAEHKADRKVQMDFATFLSAISSNSSISALTVSA